MTTERHRITLDDDANRRLYAIWSRSGKRLIITTMTPRHGERQVELRPDQVDELIRFLTDTVAAAPADR